MAISVNTAITSGDINTGFTTSVINTILTDTYDINNVPMDGQLECIERSKLGNRNSIPVLNESSPNNVISAIDIYNNLLAITSALTMVGTFSYIRKYESGSSYYIRKEMSGKALFNSDYIKTLSAVSNPGVINGQIMSTSSINGLFANLLQAWNSTTKYHNTLTIYTCHSDCHSNCYSDCYGQANCYK